MKTTMEIYPGNRVGKLSKKQRRIKKSISTYARKLHASEVKIVFYWNEYIVYYAYAWAKCSDGTMQISCASLHNYKVQ